MSEDPQPSRFEVLVRPAADADTRSLADLSGQLGYPDSAKVLATRLAGIAQREDESVLVAEIPGAGVRGFIHVFTARRLTTDPFAELGALVVDESFRGRGVGSRLLAAAEDWARARRLSHVRVRARLTREQALAFYEARDYRESKVQRVLMKDLTATSPGA